MKADLIVFGEDWGRHPSSTQHLIKRLSRDRKVLWVNSIGLRRPRFSISDGKRAVEKIYAMAKNNRPISLEIQLENLTIMNPRFIPLPGNPMARWFNRWLLVSDIKKQMIRLGITKPILWTSLPTAVDCIGILGETTSIYYCGDDFAALAGVDHMAVAELEEELVQKVDLILAASPALVKKFPSNKTHLLPHGVDADHFSQTMQRPDDLPTGRPIAGFYGNMADWIDVDLLAQVAKRMSDWWFVFVGPVNTDIQVLEELENVRFLGPKSHDVLPGYLHNWHVSMLPFKNNAQIQASNPLKLREYLSAGKPIVTTDFPALNEYRNLVSVATTAEQFATSIIEASINLPVWASHGTFIDHIDDWQGIINLAKPTNMRRNRVTKETWEVRTQTLIQLLDAV
jgi:glycosyltransferase involved in cell wall biosynthesis